MFPPGSARWHVEAHGSQHTSFGLLPPTMGQPPGLGGGLSAGGRAGGTEGEMLESLAPWRRLFWELERQRRLHGARMDARLRFTCDCIAFGLLARTLPHVLQARMGRPGL